MSSSQQVSLEQVFISLTQKDGKLIHESANHYMAQEVLQDFKNKHPQEKMGNLYNSIIRLYLKVVHQESSSLFARVPLMYCKWYCSLASREVVSGVIELMCLHGMHSHVTDLVDNTPDRELTPSELENLDNYFQEYGVYNDPVM